MFISVKRYLRIYWSIFWRYWVVICAAGILFEFISVTPPWNLMAKRIWPDYDFDQSVLEIFLKPTGRALLLATIFMALAIFRGLSSKIFRERGSPFERKQWFAIYILLGLWELFLAVLNVLVVVNLPVSMWNLLWNPGVGIVVYLTCLFIAALAFGYINKTRIAEKTENTKKPNINPVPEWRFEEGPSPEGKTRTWDGVASPSAYPLRKPDQASD